MFPVVSKLTDSSLHGTSVSVEGACKALNASDFPPVEDIPLIFKLDVVASAALSFSQSILFSVNASAGFL